MGERGKPASIHSIRYKDRKDKPRRTLADIPTSELGKATMPRWLDREAKAFWRKHSPAMEERGLLTALDEMAFALLATSWSMFREAEKLLETDGLVLQGGRGNTYPHPAVRMRDTAWKQVVEGARQFGLTPMSRQRIPIPSLPAPVDPLDEWLNKRDGAGGLAHQWPGA